MSGDGGATPSRARDEIDRFLDGLGARGYEGRPDLFGEPLTWDAYADQEFSRVFRGRYDRFVERLGEDSEPLTVEELRQLAQLMWLDERLPMRGDWRLARDHEPDFVYALAARHLRDALAASAPAEQVPSGAVLRGD